MTFFDAGALSDADAYRLLVHSVVPRPVAWCSTLDREGRSNLAPFSFFQAVGKSPPTVIVSGGRHDDGLRKDTTENVLATGEVVVNIVTEDLLDRMVATSGDHPPGVSEWDVAGVTPVPSRLVGPARVAESPVSLECRLLRSVALGEAPEDDTLLVLRVLAFHVRDDLLDRGRVDPARLRPIARLGGTGYARLGEIIHRDRPQVGRAG
jgi:flavin reductase (DIM6/NTAB) family NADH-FMN oxidoreductase RutF